MISTLCIDTSSSYCSLALRHGEDEFVTHKHLARKHNLHVLNMLDELFATAACSPQVVDVVGFGCGPGSFTGVRIAAALTQAIAFAADAKVVPVPTAKVFAHSLLAQIKQPLPSQILCCVPSRGDLFYLSQFDVVSHSEQPRQTDVERAPTGANITLTGTGSSGDASGHSVGELTDTAPSWLEQMAEDTLAVGVWPGWLPERLRSQFVESVEPSAQAMLDTVELSFRNGQACAPEQALPIYVQGDSPWVKTADRV